MSDEEWCVVGRKGKGRRSNAPRSKVTEFKFPSTHSSESRAGGAFNSVKLAAA